jgi:SRSO17 transposase
VAETRWTIESYFEVAKSEVGLDHYDVPGWTGWYRPLTLAMWALALIAALSWGDCRGNAKKTCRTPKSGAVWPPSRRGGDSPCSRSPSRS